MSYVTIIAEKPSVAAGIARIVGADTPHRDKACGYLEGNGYRVTWAFGHLVGLNRPEDMGFGGETLPILPDTWKTHIIESAKSDMAAAIRKQMKTIEVLFFGASRIIVATDAGREGELIFRYIYEYLGCRTPFDRLWISSLTDEAIRNGLAQLRDGREMDSLSEAAHARSEADWLVGFNASRALRLSSGYKGNLSLGRVQTPVLCMVCERYEANRNFVPTPFWQITALVHKDMANISVLSEKKYPTEAAADADKAKVEALRKMRVTQVEKKVVTTKPPLLFDLTALQRAANAKFGLTADETLKTAQYLYEKKYLSYPRTGSRYISEDVFKTIPSLIAKAERYPAFGDYARAMKGKKLCRKCVDGDKVTDHHALLPTEVFPSDLSGNEKRIWELVCGRMLEAFGEDSLSERTGVTFDCDGVPFKAAGSVLLKAGWKAVFGTQEAKAEQTEKDKDEEHDESENGMLPSITEGETLPAAKIETVRKTDKPLPVYSDASLLGEMETCGKKIDDEELRESMKDVGLGTPATRAATIETLISRNYIVRNGKKLTPTELGTEIWKTVRGRKIADVRTTGEWERELGLIEQGKKDKAGFDSRIRDYALEIIDDIRANCKSFSGVGASAEPTYGCPFCGRPMKNLKFNICCDAEAGGCGYRIPREVAGKKLPASALKALAQGKTTQTVNGFVSKSGKTFNAILCPDPETKKISFKFGDDPKPDGRQRLCPCCGQALDDNPWRLTCGCGFVLYKTVADLPLDSAAIDALLQGKKVSEKGFKGKNGKKFDASLIVNKEQKKVEFVFDKNRH